MNILYEMNKDKVTRQYNKNKNLKFQSYII